MQIINQAKVTFEYKKSHTSPIIIENVSSNIVITYIICNIIQVHKKVDKCRAYTFDILTYEIIIKNKGSYCVKNIIFKDLIPKGTCFIFNSIKINGKEKKCKLPYKGVYIKELAPGEFLKITFDVIVNPNCCKKKIVNYACVSYDFIYNIEKKPMRVCVKTNKVYTVKENLFKSTDIKSIINLRKISTIINNIFKIYTSVEVLGVKIITGLKNNKILVLCKINYEIKYKEGINNCSCIYSKGFSEVIFVPNGVNYYTNEMLLKNIKVFMENCNYTFLCNNKILINSQILIKICK